MTYSQIPNNDPIVQMNHALMNVLLGMSAPWLDEVLPSKPGRMIAIFLREGRVGVGPIADFRRLLTTGAPELLPSFEAAVTEVSKYPGTYLVYASNGPDHHFAVYGEGKDKIAPYVDPNAPTDVMTAAAPLLFSELPGDGAELPPEDTTSADAVEPDAIEEEPESDDFDDSYPDNSLDDEDAPQDPTG